MDNKCLHNCKKHKLKLMRQMSLFIDQQYSKASQENKS